MFLQRCRPVFFLFVLVQMSFGLTTPSDTSDPTGQLFGVVVEPLEKDCTAKPSWPQPGDVLMSWKRGDHQGDIQSPFDMLSLRWEERPHGSITLSGLTGTTPKVWVVGPDLWITFRGLTIYFASPFSQATFDSGYWQELQWLGNEYGADPFQFSSPLWPSTIK